VFGCFCWCCCKILFDSFPSLFFSLFGSLLALC
jgi:hypothetical protein